MPYWYCPLHFCIVLAIPEDAFVCGPSRALHCWKSRAFSRIRRTSMSPTPLRDAAVHAPDHEPALSTVDRPGRTRGESPRPNP